MSLKNSSIASRRLVRGVMVAGAVFMATGAGAVRDLSCATGTGGARGMGRAPAVVEASGLARAEGKVGAGGVAVGPAGGGEVLLSVRPEPVPAGRPLANLPGTSKAVTFRSRTMGEVTVSGGASDVTGAAASAFKDLIHVLESIRR